MKTINKTPYISIMCSSLLVAAAGAQTTIESFEEYANNPALLTAWSAQTATLSLSANVDPNSPGTNSMRVDVSFASSAWATEVLTGPPLSTPLAIAPSQYVTLRISGDAQFTNDTYNTLYVYAYDGSGNFGRWGAPVPITNNWQVLNFLASGIAQPYDSPALPDLSDIVQFKLFIYGQGTPPGAAFSATIYVDDLVIRDTPLIEVTPTSGPQTIEDFEEYASDADLQAVWTPDMDATLTLSSNVAFRSKGTNSMRVDIDVPANPWQTTVLTSPVRAVPMAISPSQYITLRVAGDPQFTNSSWQQLYLYAYDGSGNFGRWGAPITTTTNWQIFNNLASTIEKPWDSSALPDFNDIVQFKLFIYGQGSPAGAAFSATIYIDDITLRDAPLIEFPAPSPMRALIDNFEGYADDTALLNFYTIINSPAATVTTPSLATPAPQGNKALQLSIDFASGQYPWGAIRSATVSPFSLPTNAVVQCRFKGDPTLAPIADGGTEFWLSFYDGAGSAINFTAPAATVTSSNWTTVKASYGDFWSGTIVDTGNLVQWRILVEGWTGTADSTPLTGTFYVDDIVVTVPPVLSIVGGAGSLTLRMDSLMPGTSYTLRQTTDFSHWTTTSILATASSQTWPIPAGQKGFYQLYYTP